MQIIVRTRNCFGALNAQFLANKMRNAVRFESQNIAWDYEELNFQSTAFSKGLSSLSFTTNDNLLLRVAPGQQSQAYIAKLGTAGISANLILSQATTLQEADQQISNNKIKGIIFEPTLTLGGDLYIDTLNKLIPELRTTNNGSRVASAKYPWLNTLIQTNFYSYPGVFKFRSILNYANDKYFKLTSEATYDPVALPASKAPLFVTQPVHEFGFRAGVLNSNINGRYVIVVQAKDVNRVAEFHNEVDLVATEEIPNLSSNVRAIVQKGSSLFGGRANRIEV